MEHKVSKEQAALPKQQQQTQPRTLDSETVRKAVFGLFERYNASDHTAATLEQIAAIIASGTRMSTAQKGGKHPDEDDRDLTLQQIQHLHRERTKNGHKTAKGRTRVKERMPLFSVAAGFREGSKAKEDIIQLTGYGQCDIDDHEGKLLAQLGTNAEQLRDILARDPHTIMAYVTVSRGVRPIFAYDMPHGLTLDEQKGFYQKACEAAIAHYTRILTEAGISGTGELFDRNVAKPVQLAALACDPGVYLTNTPKVAFTIEEAEAAWTVHEAAENERKAQLRAERRAKNEALRAKRQAETARKRIDKFYEHTIKPTLEDKGEPYVRGHRDNHLTETILWLNRRGELLDDVIAWATPRFADDDFTDDFIDKKVREKYDRHQADHGTERPATPQKKATATVSDIKQWLADHISLRYNTLTARLEWSPSSLTWMPLTSRDLNTLWTWMAAEIPVNIKHLDQVVNSDYASPFNPLTAYLESLEKMQGVKVEVFDESEFFKTSGTSDSSEFTDSSEKSESSSPIVLINGRDPIAELAQTVRVKGGDDTTRFWLHCLRKWLVGMVAAWINEQVVNETILVLLGAQGTYKTTWFSLLMPPELRPYFHTKIDAARLNKDDKLTLAENALICCEELDTLTPSEQNQLKAAVSMRYVNERAAYARFKERRPHVASFCGTGNNTQLLTDRTGNRRWLPFEVQTIDTPQHIDYHHDLVFLQALTLYRKGYKYWLDADDMAYQTDHNQRFEAPSLEQELVDKYYRQPGPAESGEFVTVAEAIQVIGYGVMQKLNPVLVGKAFTSLGFQSKRSRNSKGYIAIKMTDDEIKAQKAAMAREATSD